MADDNQTPVFQIQRMYLKDLSLEQPNSPAILLEQSQPQVDINLGMALVGHTPQPVDREPRCRQYRSAHEDRVGHPCIAKSLNDRPGLREVLVGEATDIAHARRHPPIPVLKCKAAGAKDAPEPLSIMVVARHHRIRCRCVAESWGGSHYRACLIGGRRARYTEIENATASSAPTRAATPGQPWLVQNRPPSEPIKLEPR